LRTSWPLCGIGIGTCDKAGCGEKYEGYSGTHSAFGKGDAGIEDYNIRCSEPDKADAAAGVQRYCQVQQAGFEQVRAALKGFDQAWENLQEVYGRTRFVSYPAGYVPDRYFHVASQGEDLGWMIQAEELFHSMISAWLP